MLATSSWVATRGVLAKDLPASKPKRLAPRSVKDLIPALRGVHNLQITPFLPNRDFDAEGLRKNIAFHADLNVAENMTIVVGAGLGEFFSLDPDEQNALALAAVAGARGKMPVVVGVGGGYGLALRHARNAQMAGADGILLFSHAGETFEGTYEYFLNVARSVDIGVILYPRGKNSYWPDVIRRVAELPNVVGFMDSSGELAMGKALGTLISDRFLWIAEGENHAVQAWPEGARACATTVASLVPRACAEFCKHGLAGNLSGMNEVLKSRIEPAVKMRDLKPEYSVSAIKVALEALGRAGGPVRPPNLQVSPEEQRDIARMARKYSEEQ